MNIVTIRVKVFGFQLFSFHVWDDVAQHYTRCHSMSEQNQARVRKMTAKQAAFRAPQKVVS